jgi:FlaA1/EpsC-like NDP-sugar epimerase
MRRIPLKFAIDLLLWVSAAPIAFWLRLDNPWPQYSHMVLLYTALGFPLKALLIYGFGLHRQSWHKVGVRDLEALAKAMGLGVIVLAAVAFLSPPELRVPRSIPLIAGGIAFLLMGGARLLDRLLHERVRGAAPGEARRILVVGAGEAGTMIVREMLRHPEAKLLPVGFLDDEPSKRHQKFMGLPVLGTLEDLPRAVEATGANEVLIAIPSAPGRVVRRVVELARRAKLSYRIIPGVYEILSGRVSISQIREVDLEDLLRRKPVQLDLAEIASYLENRVILITGAGGSIGSEIVRQVARFRPRQVVLLGRGENSLYQIERELECTWPELDYCTVIADVRQREKMARVFEIYRPQVVFHAAAHKHVPLMERNPDEAIFNNVGGTRNLVELSLKYGVERFVNISTDKAVNPTSVMGASKRVAEYLVERAAQKAGPGQIFVSVRFGNVLGSRGSVIPLFREQIRMGGPVTVTHPEMTRYFMTIPEAAQLVLQAAGLGQNGAVYVLDMGEPVRILDLAHDLIRLSGLEPGVDIELVFTGTRPGEKLFEELLTAEEGTEASKYEKIYVARKTGLPESQLANLLEQLFAAARVGDAQQIRMALKSLIPTYVTTATPTDGS